MAFAVRHSSGFLCVALPSERCDALGLPPMSPRTQDHPGADGGSRHPREVALDLFRVYDHGRRFKIIWN